MFGTMELCPLDAATATICQLSERALDAGKASVFDAIPIFVSCILAYQTKLLALPDVVSERAPDQRALSKAAFAATLNSRTHNEFHSMIFQEIGMRSGVMLEAGPSRSVIDRSSSLPQQNSSSALIAAAARNYRHVPNPTGKMGGTGDVVKKQGQGFHEACFKSGEFLSLLSQLLIWSEREASGDRVRGA